MKLRKFERNDYNGFSGAGEQAHMGEIDVLHNGEKYECCVVVDEIGIGVYGYRDVDNPGPELVELEEFNAYVTYPTLEVGKCVASCWNSVISSEALFEFGFDVY